MQDKFERDINYLRISVTDKCNLRCVYCMPPEGIKKRSHKEFLSIEQLVEIVKEAAEIGIDKIRLTGGEPLVKRGITNLVKKIKKIEKIKFVGITTNGILLDKLAKDLKIAGIDRLNISLDTLDPDKYHKITRIGKLKDCLKGIQAAQKEKIPIKINKVVTNETTEDEIKEMEVFCKLNGFQLQLIKHYELDRIKEDNFDFHRPHNCYECNRIRLLADGTLKPCLHSNLELKVDLNNIKKSLKDAIKAKPDKGAHCDNRAMHEIGG